MCPSPSPAARPAFARRHQREPGGERRRTIEAHGELGGLSPCVEGKQCQRPREVSHGRRLPATMLRGVERDVHRPGGGIEYAYLDAPDGGGFRTLVQGGPHVLEDSRIPCRVMWRSTVAGPSGPEQARSSAPGAGDS